MTLAERIRNLIVEAGPIPVDRYMALALGHPGQGYYRTRDPLGCGGDFTTAPEISQMFGELIGLWAVEVWMLMGRPARLRLVELGPGRGTLIADALRAARVVPAFLQAATIELVETSPVLRERQRETLAGSSVPVSWHEDLSDVPDGPAIVVGNEFLDALPIRQFVRGADGWHERLVGLGPGGELAFGLAGHPVAGFAGNAAPGAVVEASEAACTLVHNLAGRLVRQGGAALFVDYGHEGGLGDTLQAVRRHAPVHPLADPGEADLTAHVDFAAIGRSAVRAGALVHGPVEQGAFLTALGICERAARLAMTAPEGGAAIEAGLSRLVGRGSDGMGALFRAVAVSAPALTELPGLPRPSARTSQAKEMATC